jgi:hypothetical protein
VKEHSRIVQDNEDERRKGRIKEKTEFNDIVRGRKNNWNKLVKYRSKNGIIMNNNENKSKERRTK